MVIAQPGIKIYGGVQFLRKILGGKQYVSIDNKTHFSVPAFSAVSF